MIRMITRQNLVAMLTCCIALTGWTVSVLAAPFKMEFTVSGFADSNGNVAPIDPISGTIVWEAANANATIDSLTSIDLTLNGHTYGLGDITFQSLPSTSPDIIYGSLNGQSIRTLTNDFWIRWHRDLLIGFDFNYASPALSGIWDSPNFDSLSVTAAVPEPTTLTLMITLGFAGIGYCYCYCRKRKA